MHDAANCRWPIYTGNVLGIRSQLSSVGSGCEDGVKHYFMNIQAFSSLCTM
jgi:hypothetical protein